MGHVLRFAGAGTGRAGRTALRLRKVLLPRWDDNINHTNTDRTHDGGGVDFGAQAGGAIGIVQVMTEIADARVRAKVQHANALAGPYTDYMTLTTGGPGFGYRTAYRKESDTALKRYVRARVTTYNHGSRVAVALYKKAAA